MSQPIACTIVANNYLAYARVLAQSFCAAHPQGAFHVLIVDHRDPALDYRREPFVCWFVEELGIPAFRSLAFGYHILELATAVKPWFLATLHAALRCPAAVYLDPDILVLHDLGPIYQRLGAYDLVLTPHVTEPVDDSLTPGERDFLLSGIFNLGFLGISFNERTLEFLDWWHRRLARYCLHAVELGLFVDQRWMDFAPAFLDRVAILREPGWNVAYWNLLHHQLEHRDGGWWTGGLPLRFFHFSGYDLARPEQISRFQNRYTVNGRPDVAPLFAEYERRLKAAQDLRQPAIEYRFGRFSNGIRVPELARSLLRETDPEGCRWPDPFATGGHDTFYSWMRAPYDRTALPLLSHLAVKLWEARLDLRLEFPVLDGSVGAAFATWLAEQGDHGIDPELLRCVD